MGVMTKLLAAGAVAAAFSSAAGAATFDFQAIADGAGFNTTIPSFDPSGAEGDWATVVGGAAVGIVDDGISVVGTGTGSDGSTLNAYFDRGSAGLGVCRTLVGAGQCSPSNDDNVGAIGGSGNAGNGTFETLILTFSTSVVMNVIQLAAEGHGPFGIIPTESVEINGITFLGTDFDGNGLLSATGLALLNLTPTSVWNFRYIPVASTRGSTNEFYIDSVTVSAVPLPAGGLLLIGALGGLAALRRRKMAA